MPDGTENPAPLGRVVSRYARPLITSFAGLVFLGYFIWGVSWPALIEFLTAGSPLRMLLWTTCAFAAFAILRALRFSVLIGSVSPHPVSFWTVLSATVQSLGLALITPFQSGEVLKIAYLTRETPVKSPTLAALFVLEKGLDLLVVASVGLAGAIYFGLSIGRIAFAGRLAAALVGILLLTGVVTGGALLAMRPKFANSGWTALPSWHAIFKALCLTVMSWGVTSCGWYGCLAAFNITVPLFKVYLLTHTATLVNVLSAIPGAIGISEVSIAWLLHRCGVESSLAQAGAIALRGFGLICIVEAALWFLADVASRRVRVRSSESTPRKSSVHGS